MRAPSPAMVVALAALFVALGGVGVAATGDPFILGNPNSASSTTSLSAPVAGKALQVSNTSTSAGATALGLTTAPGHAPFTVNTSTKVANLNADTLDGIDSTGFLRNKVPLSLTGAAASGVINGTNTGSGNGVQGTTTNQSASGVYGQNTSGFGGYGVAGRSNTGQGVGVYGEALGGGNARGVAALSNGSAGTILATNTGSGPALQLQSSGPPMSVNSSAKVDNLNADEVDGLDSADMVTGAYGSGGGRLVANRETGLVSGGLLVVPGLGTLSVVSCTSNPSRAQLKFDTAGTGNVDFMYLGQAYNSGNFPPPDFDAVIGTSLTFPGPNFGPSLYGFYRLSIARGIGSSTRIVTIWVSWFAIGCRFQAQAIESPQP
jgi:hypothetical protein